MTEYLEEVFLPDDCFLLIKLDVERIKLLKLEVNADSIRYEILKAPKLKIKPKDCNVVSDSLITIRPGVSGKSSMYYHLQYLKERIGKIFFYLKLNYVITKKSLRLVTFTCPDQSMPTTEG